MQIRPATRLDASAMAELLNTLIVNRDGTSLRDVVTVEAEADFISAVGVEGLVLVAEESGKLLGFQSVERIADQYGEIGTFIEADARSQGVGRKLFEIMRSWADWEGVEMLVAAVAEENVRGIRAYTAWGFEEASEEILNQLRFEADWVGEKGKVVLVNRS